MKMSIIDNQFENNLENFLKENENIVYGIKTLSKRLNMRKKHIYYL